MKLFRVLFAGFTVVLAGQTAVFATHECVLQPIACGQTVSGTISGSECSVGTGFFADPWSFSATNGQQVTIDMRSTQLDSYLQLADPDQVLRASDDDSGTDVDARLAVTLDKTGSWVIYAENSLASDTGPYTLSLQCNAGTSVCVQDSTTACLLNGRFRARVRFRNVFDNAAANADALRKPVTGFANANFETVFFYFNSVDNIEILLKMLDQGNTNGAGQPTIAVLFGSATPLRTEVTITDTFTGAVRTYVSQFGTQQGATDFAAFVK
jgi:hypothetical protein